MFTKFIYKFHTYTRTRTRSHQRSHQRSHSWDGDSLYSEYVKHKFAKANPPLESKIWLRSQAFFDNVVVNRLTKLIVSCIWIAVHLEREVQKADWHASICVQHSRVCRFGINFILEISFKTIQSTFRFLEISL